MKPTIYNLVLILLLSISVHAKSQRKPNSEDSSSQVQLCEGTEAFGSEGQGMAVSALLNYSVQKNYQTNTIEKKCELGVAFAFEYGNDRGFKLGRFSPYNVAPVAGGKTQCSVAEENGEIYLTLTKATGKILKSGVKAKVLIDRCRLTASGY